MSEISGSTRSATYDRTSGIHMLAGLAAGAECRGPVKKKELENVSTANALQLEAGRRRADPIRFNTSRVASLKSLSLSAAVLDRIYCLCVTLRCDLELLSLIHI